MPPPGPHYVQAPHYYGSNFFVSRFLVSPGDRVQAGDVVAQVRTGDVESPVTTDYAGTVKRWVRSEGELIDADATLIIIDPDEPSEEPSEGSGLLRPLIVVAVIAGLLFYFLGRDDRERVESERLVRCDPERKITDWNPDVHLEEDSTTAVVTPAEFGSDGRAGIRLELTACKLEDGKPTADRIASGDTVTVAWLAQGAKKGEPEDSLCVRIGFTGGTLLKPLESGRQRPKVTRPENPPPGTRNYNIPRAWPEGDQWTGGRYRVRVEAPTKALTKLARCGPRSVEGGAQNGAFLILGQ